jgi:hypothetical protein
MNNMNRFATASFATGLVVGSIFFSVIASAWTTPTLPAPTVNATAPVNIGSAAQTKNGTLGVNGLAVFGNSLLQAGSYLGFGATSGSAGYGIRDNAGAVEFKNSGGSWQSAPTIASSSGGPVDIGLFGPVASVIISVPFSSVEVVGGSWVTNGNSTGVTMSGHMSVANINGVWKYAATFASGQANTGTLVAGTQVCPLSGANPTLCLTRNVNGTLTLTTSGNDAIGGPKFFYTVYGQ